MTAAVAPVELETLGLEVTSTPRHAVDATVLRELWRGLSCTAEHMRDFEQRGVLSATCVSEG